MCSPSEVSQSVNVPVTQMPANSSSTPIPHVPSPLPMNAAWQEAPTSIRPATRMAYVGRHRRNSRSPSMAPTPKQAVMTAQQRAPSSSRSISTGPITKIAGSTTGGRR